MSKKFKQLVFIFKKEVFDQKEKIDPSEEQDWYSLTLGWAIAKGRNPTDAHEFALYIRYKAAF